MFTVLVYLGIGALVLCALCFVIAAFADDYVTVEPEQRTTIYATELCMVRGCHNEWQREVNGWVLCHKHYANSGAA